MPLSLLDAGSVSRTLTRLGVWDGTRVVQFQTLKVMDADGVTLRTVATFAASLSASISPSPVSKTVFGPSGGIVTTGVVTCTPTGGLGPYTYAWTCTANSNATAPTIAAPANASTSFTQTDVDTTDTATFQCIVTDATGASVTVSVNATFNIVSI